jgi:hypothetical protein
MYTCVSIACAANTAAILISSRFTCQRSRALSDVSIHLNRFVHHGTTFVTLCHNAPPTTALAALQTCDQGPSLPDGAKLVPSHNPHGRPPGFGFVFFLSKELTGPSRQHRVLLTSTCTVLLTPTSGPLGWRVAHARQWCD